MLESVDCFSIINITRVLQQSILDLRMLCPSVFVTEGHRMSSSRNAINDITCKFNVFTIRFSTKYAWFGSQAQHLVKGARLVVGKGLCWCDGHVQDVGQQTSVERQHGTPLLPRRITVF